MKIAQSQVAMSSDRQYVKMEQQKETDVEEASVFQNVTNDWSDLDSRSRTMTLRQIQRNLIMQLIYRLTRDGKLEPISDNLQNHFWTLTATTVRHQEVTQAEYEKTGFQSQGRAVTEDGRTIDFRVNLLMSRSYLEYTETETRSIESILLDPLVINVGSGVTEISDQTFLFDLDGDGKKERISQLGQGSGFLALDLNGDGVINDGNELFGTKSGNGFADLQKYDKDGNGWIDENDEIFSRLKVWCKGEHGEDILMSLKEADVGAIFLGNQATEFSLYGQENKRNAVIRSTGIFLKESGGAGTVQQVDLAARSQPDPSVDDSAKEPEPAHYSFVPQDESGRWSKTKLYKHNTWNRFKQSYNLG